MRAVLPALPPPSFPSVTMHSASRLTGADVVLPDSGESLKVSNSIAPSILGRKSSVVGNILCVNDNQYFWLQRKIRATPTKGSIRVGFCLKKPTTKIRNTMDDNIEWEVVVAPPDESIRASNEMYEPQVQMVAIRVENMVDFLNSPELAALNFISANTNRFGDNERLQAAFIIAADSADIYIIMPYDYSTSSSLLEYCLAKPHSILSENEARVFFRQLIQVSVRTRIVAAMNIPPNLFCNDGDFSALKVSRK
jgi:hypothetical protein